jgi:transposase
VRPPFESDELVAVGAPVRHQVEELPRLAVMVTEHQCPRVRCPACGRRERAALGAEIANSAFGPRFHAVVAVLSVRNRVSYTHLPLRRRQICWAHLRRDFKAHAEGMGAEKEFGEHGLRICEELFWSWEIYVHTRDRTELKRRIRALRHELKAILRQYSGKAPRYKYCRRMARNLLKVRPALWTFADHKRVEPTNNHAERALRGPVIYRKLRLGSQSANGEQRIERLLSVHTTCRPPTPAATRLPPRCLPRPFARRPRTTTDISHPRH